MSGGTIILGGMAVFAYASYLGFVWLRVSMLHAGDWFSYFSFYDFWAKGAPFFIGGMLFGLGIMAGGALGIGKALDE
jgi:hypothetical protein